ncbi:MAG: NAD(P)/FAD-dependent oxidoreductase, partial [Waddliaceae bacterium]
NLTNGEVITMEIVGEFLGKDCDKTIWEYFKSHWKHFFPNIPDCSDTIIDCFFGEAQRLGVNIRTQTKLHAIRKVEKEFELDTGMQPPLFVHRVILATGSSRSGWEFAKSLGGHGSLVGFLYFKVFDFYNSAKYLSQRFKEVKLSSHEVKARKLEK